MSGGLAGLVAHAYAAGLVLCEAIRSYLLAVDDAECDAVGDERPEFLDEIKCETRPPGAVDV
jgi:hypothetical protein